MPDHYLSVSGEAELPPREYLSVSGGAELPPREYLSVSGEAELPPREYLSVSGEAELPDDYLSVNSDLATAGSCTGCGDGSTDSTNDCFPEISGSVDPLQCDDSTRCERAMAKAMEVFEQNGCQVEIKLKTCNIR